MRARGSIWTHSPWHALPGARALVARLALFALLATRSSVVHAQGNDRSAPTGGRSELMGNTGVALAKDGSAPFLNPATIGMIEDERVAFSVNFYTYSNTHYSGWDQPGPTDPQFGKLALTSNGDSASRFHGLPSTLCLFFTLAGLVESDAEGNARGERRGRQKLAFCIGSLEADGISLNALAFRGATPAGATVQTESITRGWNRLYIGPTYSVSVTDALALGASLHGVVTSDSFVVDGNSITSITGGNALSSGMGTSGYGYSFDLAATLGATYRMGMVTLGASAELPALHVLGRFQSTSHNENSAADATDNVTNGAGYFSARPPMRVAAGVGIEWPRLTLEADESFDFPSSSAISSTMRVDSTDLMAGVPKTTSFDARYLVSARPMLNTSVGAEYFVTRGFSLIGGGSTNFSTLKALSPTESVGNLVQSRTNHAALSFGIGSYGGGRDILIGLQLDYGWGQALVVNPYQVPNTWSVIGTQTYSAMAVLAGATDLRTIGRAVEKVRNAVFTGTPDEPAPASPASPPAAPKAPNPEPAPASPSAAPKPPNPEPAPPDSSHPPTEAPPTPAPPN